MTQTTPRKSLRERMEDAEGHAVVLPAQTTKRYTKKQIIDWCEWRVSGPTSGTELRGIHKDMIAAILKLLRNS